ncbi:MAG TPA: YncE family protein [Acidimicrobiales bacterium]
MAIALLVTACGGKSPATAPTGTTLPPLPPDVVALVTLIGQGSAIGTGASLYGVDLTSGASTAAKSFAVGTFPDAVAATPDGNLALVANYGAGTVTPIDLLTGKVRPAIQAGAGPAGVAVAPNGKMAYVTDAGSAPIGTTITPIDLATDKAMSPITVGAGPQGIVISPDGTTAWVSLAGAVVAGQSGSVGSSVVSVNLSTRAVSAPIPVGNAPLAVVLSNGGQTLWVANAYSGSVTPITTSTRVAGTPIAVEGAPDALAVSPDSQTVFVADEGSSVAKGNNVTPISTSTLSVSAPLAVAKAPTGLAVTPDGSTLWVVSSGAGSLEPINLAAKPVTVETEGAVAIAGGPYAIALVTEQHSVAVRSLGAVPAKKKTKTS